MGIEAKDLETALAAVEAKLGEALTQYEGEVKEYGEATNAIRDELKALTEDHKGMIESDESVKERLKAIEQDLAAGKTPNGGDVMKSWGQSFVDSEQFKSLSGDAAGIKGRSLAVEVKNTILGEGGSPQDPVDTIVAPDRMAGIVPGAFRAMTLLDFVATGVTASNQLEYTREASYTNSSAETAEGGAKPESAITFELVNDPVRTIASFIKASKQVLDDAPALASYIDRRLRYGIRQRLQSQILNGNGTSPNLSGISASGRHTAFTPTTGDTALDTLNRAKYTVVAADYQPNFILMNPTDWGSLERTKSTTGEYIGGEAVTYINNGMTPLVWGIPVVASNDVASGKFLMGDSMAFQLFMRQGAIVEMFEQDSDNVQKNLLTIRAELRAALAVFVPAALQYGSLTV